MTPIRDLSRRPLIRNRIAAALDQAFAQWRPIAAGAIGSGLVLLAGEVNAAAPLPKGTLPVPAASNFVASGAVATQTAGAALTVNQTSPRAVLNWQSFNVAADAHVRFNQPSATAATLNRIHDANPSVIQGRISANGQVYMINRNGILFDRGAQVNVNTLVATTLNVADEVFDRGLLSQPRLDQAVFSHDGTSAEFGKSFVRVENGAQITTETNGRVLLLAPRVENNGTIATPEGQTVLAAGAKVYLAASADTRLRGFLVEVDPAADGSGGKVSNETLGRIVAERGNVTLVGLAVNQSGRVSATTASSLNGSIVLSARDTAQLTQSGLAGARGGSVVLGPGSVTEVRPDTGDTRTTQDSQPFLRSQIAIRGASVHVRENAQVVAPSGEVNITAQQGLEFQTPGAARQPNVKIHLEQGSRIDVAGLRDVPVPIERNILAVDLRGNEFKDAPLQRDGRLRNQTVRIDIRKGTPLADVAGLIAQVDRGVDERSTQGGTVTMRSEGDIVLRQASAVDVSGGNIRFSDGYLATTKLFTADGKLVDIGAASPDRIYAGIADQFVVRDEKFGRVKTFTALTRGEFTPGYVEGSNAGAVTLTAHRVVVDGGLKATTVIGPFQREQKTRPLGGSFVLGDPAEQPSPVDYKVGSITFAARRDPLPADFQFDSALPEPWASSVSLPTTLTRDHGFSRVTLFANDAITLLAAESLEVAPWGSVQLNARRIVLDGTISLPAGSIVARTRVTSSRSGAGTLASEHALSVGAGAVLTTAGGWVNESARAQSGSPFAPIAIHGGSISLSSQADVLIAAGSVLDVSAGAHVSAAERLTLGNAGSITLATGRFGLGDFDAQTSVLRLNGELRAFALGAGGALTISASRARLGGAPNVDPVELQLGAQVLFASGLRKLTVTGHDGLVVAADTRVPFFAQSLVLDGDFALRPTGTPLAAFTRRELLPAALRSASELTLSTGSRVRGDLRIEPGAVLEVDARGRITLTSARRLTVEGQLAAPAGQINLATQLPSANDAFLPEQSIWLGAGAVLSAHGITVPKPNRDGLLLGDVLDGGTVTINALSGYVIATQAARIDVSGTASALDVATQTNERVTLERRMVTSAGGTIAISAREGVLLDAGLSAHAGGANAAGGAFSIALERATIPLGFPAQGPRRIVIAHSGRAVPAGLNSGEAIPDALNGIGRVHSERISAGGFHRFAAESEHRIEFDGVVHLAAARSLTLDAPALLGGSDSRVTIASGYLGLGNLDAARASPVLVQSGTARLDAHAAHIDLIGNFALDGFERTVLAASGDLQLRGIVASASTARPEGGLRAGGDLELRARQVYPTTRTRYRIEALGSAATLAVLPANAAVPVLSTDASLTLKAADVRIAGAVKAPFGEIVIDAANRLTLESGALVSISAEGQTIPFGATELSGRRYVYPLAGDNRVIVNALADKRVALKGSVVTLDQGARIDLSGGGELFATEFLPGTGGSRDVLDPASSPDSFAILPSLRSAFGPADPYYALNVTGLAPGDGIALAGVPGLADGTYALLPARYALLPGAYLVTPVAGTQDMVGAQSFVTADGSVVVPGRRVAAGRDGIASQASRPQGYNVRAGSSARAQSEYRDVTGSAFFGALASPVLPADAGRMVIEAARELVVNARVDSLPAASGRGSAIDIAAPRVVIAASATQPIDAGAVRLDATRLSALDAASLLIGGIRSIEDGATRIDVRSSAIIVANDAASAVRAPEIMLAASDEIQLRRGAAMVAQGAVGRVSASLAIGEAQGVSGDGALLRASAGGDIELRRANVSRSRGTLVIEPGATLAASGALLLDATFDARLGGDLALAAGGALSLGAGRVSIGATEGVTQGLVLSNERLRTLGTPGALSLRSYTSVDFYGPVELGNERLANLAITSGGIAGYGVDRPAVTLRAERVALGGGNGLAFAPAPPLADGSTPLVGGGALRVAADAVALGGGVFELRGFANVELQGSKNLRFVGDGSLTTDAPLTLASARIDSADRARFDVRSSATLALVDATPRVPLSTLSGAGATMGFYGRNVSVATAIDAPSGRVRIEASGSAASDDVVLAPGSRTSVAGRATIFADTTVAIPAGQVELSAGAGNVTIAAGAVLDVSAPAGGSGGSLDVSAPHGRFTALGELIGGAAGSPSTSEPPQSAIRVDVATVADFSALQSALNPRSGAPGDPMSHGFTGERRFRVRSDDIVLAADTTLMARDVVLSADRGNVDIRGSIDATAARGGRIELYAGESQRLDVRAGARLDAKALAEPIAGDTRGGRVMLGVGSRGTLALASGATIDVSAPSGASGAIVLRAPRAGNDVAIEPILATLVGAAAVTVEAYRVYERVGNANITALGSTAGTGRLTFNQINADNTAYLSSGNVAAMRDRLELVDTNATRYAIRAGVEVRAAGNLTLASDWDLRAARPGGQPGALTLRAAGDLLLASNLSDGFSNATANGILQAGDSWRYRLIGGADLNGADPLAARLDGGNVEVAAGRIVRTGTGDIDISAGRDVLLRYTVRPGTPVTLNLAPGVVYTAGTAGPVVSNFPTISIGSIAASFPTRGGDLRVRARRDIAARSTTASDITSAPITQYFTDWLYRQGSLAADGTIGSFSAPRTAWWPRFSDFRQGFGALGGGNVEVSAGRDIDSISISIPTNGRLSARNNSVPDPTQLVVQGGGDLRVRAGNNIDSAGFLVGAGDAHIDAGGRIGASRLTASGRRALYSTLALGQGSATLASRGDLTIETVVSPTALEQVPANLSGSGGLNRRSYFFTYGEASRVGLASSAGNVTLLNDPVGLSQFAPHLASGIDALFVYPATVHVAAPLGDIRIGGKFELYPAPHGTLDVLAGGSITVDGRIGMIDAPAARLPDPIAPDRTTERIRLQAAGLSPTGADAHSNPPLHRDDPQPVRFVALDGDIVGVVSIDPQGIPNIGTMAILAKRFLLAAGGDVRDTWIFAHNLRDDDLSLIQAGRDFRYSTVGGSGSRASIELGGPGWLEITAGGDIDLGDSRGVTTRGNLNNPGLPERGAGIALLSGAAQPDYRRYLDRAFADSARHNARLVAGLIPYLRFVTADARLGAGDVLAAYRSLPSAVKSLFYRDDLRKVFDAAKAALASWESLSAPARAASGTGPAALVLALTRFFPAEIAVPQTSAELSAFEQRLFAALSDVGEVRTDPGELSTQLFALPQARRHALARELLFTRLKDAGRAAPRLPGGIERYADGYQAITDLFATPDASRTIGDLNLFFSQVKTEQGGDIDALVPGGVINAGLASIDGSGKAASELGIVTIRGGSISAMARDDVLVNQSRVFTLQGGDILLWSSLGNIDAGKGAKSATATPPPQLITRGDQIVLDISGSVSGSGIGVLLARDGIAAGDVDLIAPRGEVNAGEAPIRAAGNINIAAERVVGADNIQVGGTASGVAIQSAPSLSAAVAAPSSSAGDAARSAEQATRNSAAAGATGEGADPQRFRPTLLTVEVLGFDDEGAPAASDDRKRR